MNINQEPTTSSAQSTTDRKIKKDSRIRGSGSRNVKANHLNIDPSENKRLVSQLSSALTKDGDLELSRSSRRKSSILPYKIIERPKISRKSTTKRVSFKENSQPRPQQEEAEIEVDSISNLQDFNDEENLEYSQSNITEDSLIPSFQPQIGKLKRKKPSSGKKSKIALDNNSNLPSESILKNTNKLNSNISKAKSKIDTLQSRPIKRHTVSKTALADSPRSSIMETSLFGDTESAISIAHDNTKNTLKALKKVPSRSKKSSNSVESSLISESITKQKESVQPSPTIPKESSVETILSEESEDDTDDNESDNEIKHDDNAYDPDYGRPIISRRKGKGKGKGLPIISSRRKRALPLFDNNANHGNGKTRKTLTIDYPSLVNAANTRGRVQRARMLDVLRYLVSSFDPEVPDNRLHLHQRFQKHLLSSIDNVRDAATSVEDVAKNIASVQKAKKQLRQMILDLRKDHTDIGNQLNELRLQVTNKKLETERLDVIYNQLQEVKAYTENPNNNITTKGNLSSTVHMELASLQKIANQTSGLRPTLERINNKLETLDNSI